MPLTLITGPANSAKAQVVLDGYRARLDESPLLVVPTAADVDHYRRELAAAGAVFGPAVMTFRELIGEVARRAGVLAPILGRVQAERVVAVAVAGARLGTLTASAASPGFVRAARRLIEELERELIEPPRFTAALRAWAGPDAERRAYADEIAAIYAGHRRILDRLGRPDRELFAARAIAALAGEPRAWGATPVFVYGFDDLTTAQRATIRTLAQGARADVTVSLTFEAGRLAFAGRAETFADLRPDADRHQALPPRAEHYAPAARPALHHLERTLFEDGHEPADPGGAVRVLESGGQRAEAELVAAEVLALLRAGTPAEEIAVVLRSLRREAATIERVFSGYGVPFALERPVVLGHTALGRGLLALLRCALADGTASDLLAWLRTPGKLDRQELADALEVELRRAGATTAAQARELWERGPQGWALDELGRLGAAATAGPLTLLDAVDRAALGLFRRPRAGRAAVLVDDELPDARALAVVRGAVRELRELVRADAGLAPAPAELVASLAALEVSVGPAPGPGRVAVLRPMDVRARRFQALFLCGLQDGAFPRPGRPDPFLGDRQRLELNAASGLRLGLHEDALADERALFYACASRPEALLALSFRSSDEEGSAQRPSPFVEDVATRFAGGLRDTARRRLLAEVTWPLERAPTEHERARARAAAAGGARERPIASLAAPAVLGWLRAEPAVSPAALERYGRCPVGWFVDRVLRPASIDPDGEALRRGALMHEVLAQVLRTLRARTGSARVTPATLEQAEALVDEALAGLAGVAGPGDATRTRVAVRRLAGDVRHALRREAATGERGEPEHIELEFGLAQDGLPVLELAGGMVRVRGRIDRVDVEPDGSGATVRDYKSSAAGAAPRARWDEDGTLQIPLYMLAVRRVLGLELLAGLYQPVTAKDPRLRARGLVLDTPAARDLVKAVYVRTDLATRDEFEAQLARSEATAVSLAGDLRDGVLEPSPARCAYWAGGGCAFPGICRSGA